MRLTVGGALVFLGIGAVAGFLVADKANLNFVKDKVKGMTDQAGSLVGLFKSGESEKKTDVYSPPPPVSTSTNVQTSTAGSSAPLVATPPVGGAITQSSPSVSLPAVVEATPEPAPVVPVKPVKKKNQKQKHSRKAKKSVAAPKAAAAKPKPSVKKTAAKVSPKTTAGKDSYQNLIGTYVSLELVTGRSVQGVLESKSATHYTLNVPGLGPLPYPIENVKSIVPAN